MKTAYRLKEYCKNEKSLLNRLRTRNVEKHKCPPGAKFKRVAFMQQSIKVMIK